MTQNVSLFATLWLAGICLGGSCACATETESPAAVQVLTIADGNFVVREGQLVDWTQEAILLGDRHISLADIVALRWRRACAERRDALIALANGDLLNAEVVRLDETHITAAWNVPQDRPDLRLPLEIVAGFVTRYPDSPTAQDRVRRRVEAAPPTRDDYLYLKNGDRFAGVLSGFRNGTFQMQPTGTEQQLDIAAEQVLAARFNPDLVSFPSLEGRSFLIELTDGSRLTAQSVVSEEQTVRIALPYDVELLLPREAICSVQILGDRVISLTSLPVRDYRYRPFVAGDWELGINRAVTGTPLRLQGRECALGFGMHSYSEVSFDLSGRFARFRCRLGLDDASRSGGSVAFRVLADGAEVFHSGEISGTDPPQLIENLDVSHAQTLTLVVDFAERGDILDRADWCQPLLLRNETADREDGT